jgi:hypothetical protein
MTCALGLATQSCGLASSTVVAVLAALAPRKYQCSSHTAIFWLKIVLPRQQLHDQFVPPRQERWRQEEAAHLAQAAAAPTGCGCGMTLARHARLICRNSAHSAIGSPAPQLLLPHHPRNLTSQQYHRLFQQHVQRIHAQQRSPEEDVSPHYSQGTCDHIQRLLAPH